MNRTTSFSPWHRLISRSSKPAPLPSLYNMQPDRNPPTVVARHFETIKLDAVLGTAVAGAAQRGADFLPRCRPCGRATGRLAGNGSRGPGGS